MLVGQKHEALFRTSALIVVDPYWKLEQEDFERFPSHERECQEFVSKKIEPSLRYFRQGIVTTWGDRDIHPGLQHLRRVYTASELQELVSVSEPLFFSGFHYGRCVLKMPAGLRAMQSLGYSCTLLEDLTMLFPADQLQIMRSNTRKSGVEILSCEDVQC